MKTTEEREVPIKKCVSKIHIPGDQLNKSMKDLERKLNSTTERKEDIRK